MLPNDPNPFAISAAELELPTGCRPQKWEFPFEDYTEQAADCAWRQMEREFRPGLDAAAREWVVSREWPDLSPEQEYFFRLRFRVASQFLFQFPFDSTSLLRFPDVPPALPPVDARFVVGVQRSG